MLAQLLRASKRPRPVAGHLLQRSVALARDASWAITGLVRPRVRIWYATKGEHTEVDHHWADYTVIRKSLAMVKTPEDSLAWAEFRYSLYPLFREYHSHVYNDHDGQVILDYGCGPATDIIGFLTYSNPARVVGMDVSEKALKFAQWRLALHKTAPKLVDLIRVSDADNRIPLPDGSVDFVFCHGVLHHTSHPEQILREFSRVLKGGAGGWIMVYNHDSINLHLFVAYERMILRGEFAGQTLYEAYTKSTDSDETPISRCYRPEEFLAMVKEAGLDAEYIGGYFDEGELGTLEKHSSVALQDERLGEEHREFLKVLSYDEQGYPMYRGKHAGTGGVYRLYKPPRGAA